VCSAHQRDTDRGGIYTTLTRRGRRSSFNNVRRLYEDQVNVRRVKQYMQQIEIITDEDKLVEMSKAVEPPGKVVDACCSGASLLTVPPSRLSLFSRAASLFE